MTVQEQVILATDKVARWRDKRERVDAMLKKWQGRLSALQSKGKTQPKTQPASATLPPLTLVSGSEHLMPRTAITSAADQAIAEQIARETAMRDMAEEKGDDAKPINGKVKPAKAKKKVAKKH